MELVVKQQPLAPIQANLDDIRKYVEKAVTKYNGAFYADNEIKQAKVDRADLRKLKEDIETKRKQVKSVWNEPYLAFESELKSITALIDRPVELIDIQIKDYEQRRKDVRKDKLLALFNKNNTLGELVKFENIFEPQWLNASISEAKAVRFVIDKLEMIQRDIAQLESVVSPENRTVCLDHYLNTLNLADAIIKDTVLKSKRTKQEQFLGVVEDVPIAINQELANVQEEVEDIFANIPLRTPQNQPDTRKFLIIATPAQIHEFRVWCKEHGLTVREVF